LEEFAIVIQGNILLYFSKKHSISVFKIEEEFENESEQLKFKIVYSSNYKRDQSYYYHIKKIKDLNI